MDRDNFLQQLTPTVMVPKFKDLEPMAGAGHRFLMARDGLWLEAIRPWARVVVNLYKSEVAMPYGEVEKVVDFKFGRLPTHLVQEFIGHAKQRCPNECASWIVWDERDNTFELVHLEETSVGVGHVEFVRPLLEDKKHLVLDLHSHGHFHAFFSETDNNDDKGEFKVAGVVGFSEGELTTVFRLCVNGKFDRIPVATDRFTVDAALAEV